MALPSLLIVFVSRDGRIITATLSDHLLLGVVGASDQRAGFDMAEAHREPFGLELGKLIWMVEPRHW